MTIGAYPIGSRPIGAGVAVAPPATVAPIIYYRYLESETMGELRQSTSQVIRFGPMLDSSGSPLTGLTITQADMQLSKDGAAFAQKNAAGNATHDTDGFYSTTLNATDTNTAGQLIFQVNVSGALPYFTSYNVVEDNSYDAIYTNGLNNIAATDIVSGGAITTSGGAVSNVTLVATTTTNTDMRGTDSALLASSAPTNFGSMVISGAGSVDSLVQGFLNSNLTETTTGRIAGNFDVFFENADALTTKVVDDVGTGGGGGGTDWSASERNEIRGRLGITGTTAAGGNTPTLSTQASINALNDFDPASDTVANVTTTANVTNGVTISGTITTLDGLENISAADVNAQVLDVMTTDTFAEPTSVPAATSSLEAKIGYMFAKTRNRSTQTASIYTLRNDADSANISTHTVADDGTTFTKGEDS